MKNQNNHDRSSLPITVVYRQRRGPDHSAKFASAAKYQQQKDKERQAALELNVTELEAEVVSQLKRGEWVVRERRYFSWICRGRTFGCIA